MTEKPYSIVSVSTSIAIWGIEYIKHLPDMKEFLEVNKIRLSTFPQDSPSSGQRPWQFVEDGGEAVAGGQTVAPDSTAKEPFVSTFKGKVCFILSLPFAFVILTSIQ